MSPRSLSLLALCAFVSACGGDAKDVDEPKTAREKLRAENKDKEDSPSTRPWGKWRYTGDRASCFYRVGQKCFKTEAAACNAARCGKGKCEVEGAAPASVSCKKK